MSFRHKKGNHKHNCKKEMDYFACRIIFHTHKKSHCPPPSPLESHICLTISIFWFSESCSLAICTPSLTLQQLGQAQFYTHSKCHSRLVFSAVSSSAGRHSNYPLRPFVTGHRGGQHCYLTASRSLFQIHGVFLCGVCSSCLLLFHCVTEIKLVKLCS